MDNRLAPRTVAIRLTSAEAELLDSILGDVETISGRNECFRDIAFPGNPRRKEFSNLCDKAALAYSRAISTRRPY